MIAEAAKTEPLAQSGLLNLDPADGFQVAGGHAQQRALPGQVVKRLFHARHADQVQLAALFGNCVAHRLQNGLGALFHHCGWNAGLLAGLAQNGCIRAAVQQNARQRDLKPRHPLHAGGKGVEVDAVAAAQQRAVDVE